jgi:hypothetical protein
MSIQVIWLEVHYPGQDPTLAGYILMDQTSFEAEIRLSASWDWISNPEDRRVLMEMEDFISSLFQQDPQSALQSASNVLRCSDPLVIRSAQGNLRAVAGRLSKLLLEGYVGDSYSTASA